MKRPLWLQRVLLIALAPLLLLIALIDALSDGWAEFCCEIKYAARDLRQIWREGQ